MHGAAEAVLVLPAFAEEMNKCRRMIALLAQAAQVHGIDVFNVDLTGTGDSAGDFREATVERWNADLAVAAAWLHRQGVAILHVVAVRGGALLLEGLDLPVGLAKGKLLLWQPVTNGRQLVSQFLRLRNAEVLVGGAAAEAGDARRILHDDGFVEVAGYDLSRALVEGLEPVTLSPLALRDWRHSRWFEITAPAAQGMAVAAPSPAAVRSVAGLSALGIQVDLEVVEGEPFWATPEIAVLPALVDRSIAFIGGKP